MILPPPFDKWDENTLDDIAASEETNLLEKKASPKFRQKPDGSVLHETVEEIARQVSAFANSRDGYIVFAVDHPSRSLDAGVPGRVGQGGRIPIKEWAEQVIPTSVHPHYHDCTARFLRKPGHHGVDSNGIELGVLAVYVPLSNARPHSIQKNSGDVAYIRAGEHSAPMSHQTLLALGARAAPSSTAPGRARRRRGRRVSSAPNYSIHAFTPHPAASSPPEDLHPGDRLEAAPPSAGLPGLRRGRRVGKCTG
jgi:hypothetical protein